MSKKPLKLTYFNIRGRAELCRLLLAASKEKYEDNRITGDDWKTLKPTTPQGQVPILEVDGDVICQSMAIARFLAKRFGLMGSGDKEEAKINEILETIVDLRTKIVAAHFEKDDAKKETLKKELQDKTFPECFKYLEDKIKSNGCKEGYIVGKKPSVADFNIYELFETPLKETPSLLDKGCEGIKKLRAKVASLDGIKEYLAKRPETNI